MDREEEFRIMDEMSESEPENPITALLKKKQEEKENQNGLQNRYDLVDYLAMVRHSAADIKKELMHLKSVLHHIQKQENFISDEDVMGVFKAQAQINTKANFIYAWANMHLKELYDEAGGEKE